MSWNSLPIVEPDGSNLPLSVVASLHDIPVERLRKAVREQDLQPSGVIRMNDFRRSGRHPMAYPATELINIAQGLQGMPGDAGEEVFSPFA